MPTTTPQPHQTQVPYARVRIKRADVGDGWEFWEGGGLYYASGVCPRCGATGQEAWAVRHGPFERGAAPPDDGRLADAMPDAPLEDGGDDGPPDIAFDCACDDAHGRQDSTGCGARWTVVWRAP